VSLCIEIGLVREGNGRLEDEGLNWKIEKEAEVLKSF
jgi:hypothetical protein